MRYQKPMHLLAAAGLLVGLFCAPGLFSIAAAQVPTLPDGADNDGYADLAVGIPGLNVDGDDGAGALGLFFGYSGGLSQTGAQYFDQETAGIYGGAEPLDHFARTLAAGDFNRDGYMDLAIGVPDEDISVGGSGYSDAGLVHVLYGGADGFSGARSDAFSEETVEAGAAVSEHWGAALASGDFNCDGYDDLAVGAPGEDFVTIESAGMVRILNGSSAGLSSAGGMVLWQGLPVPMPESPDEGDNFGKALAAGDFDGDGCHDLAIGAPNEALQIGPTIYSYAGVVLVAYGSDNGITSAGSDLFYQGNTIQDAVEDYDFFGDALAAGDFNKDGRDDLAIGVPKEDYPVNDAGIVQLLYGDLFGLTSDNNLRFDQSMCGEYAIEEYDRFGYALAAGDFNFDGRDDLVIGAPGQTLTGSEEAGMVCVMFGSNMTTNTWTWANPNPAEGDHFGAALAVGDVDDNGFDDLAVVAPEDDALAADSGTVYLRRRTAANTWFTTVIFDLEDINDTLTPAADDEFGTALAMLDEPNTHMTFLALPVVMK